MPHLTSACVEDLSGAGMSDLSPRTGQAVPGDLHEEAISEHTQPEEDRESVTLPNVVNNIVMSLSPQHSNIPSTQIRLGRLKGLQLGIVQARQPYCTAALHRSVMWDGFGPRLAGSYTAGHKIWTSIRSHNLPVHAFGGHICSVFLSSFSYYRARHVFVRNLSSA